MDRFASIDMGTNTFRLLIVEMCSAQSFHEVYTENRTTRLGEGFSEEKRISAAATARAISALKHFLKCIEKAQVTQVYVFGTSALRQAKNRASFIKSVREETGFRVEVFTGKEEAYYTLMGVNLVFQNRPKEQDRTVIIDIGGGSTEFIVARNGHPDFLYSANLGTVTLTEKFLRTDPPVLDEIKALENEVVKQLQPLERRLPQKALFVGTAGTVTTLAAMELGLSCYDPLKINHFVLKRRRIEQRLEGVLKIPISAWSNLPGLEKGRADILIAGILILRCIMDVFGYNRIAVSDYGLREGVLVSRFRGNNKQVSR